MRLNSASEGHQTNFKVAMLEANIAQLTKLTIYLEDVKTLAIPGRHQKDKTMVAR